MKKLTVFLATLLLSGCYYTVPAQQVYYEDTYAATYSVPASYDSSVYVVQEQPTVYYQNQPSVVYIDDTPDVIVYDSPFIAARPHYYHAPAPIMHRPHGTPSRHMAPRTPTHHSVKSHNSSFKHSGRPEKLPGKNMSHHGGRK